MMRPHSSIVLCALGALALATSFAFSSPQEGPPGQGGGPQGQGPKPEELLRRIEALEQKVATLTAFNEAQGKAGNELLDALKRAESEGFTAGINPKSREALLAGLRAQAEVMKTGAGDSSKNKSTLRLRGDRNRRRQER